jgi:CBS domain-containing protein
VEYLAVVSQLDVIDAMVRDADALGAFVRLKSMSDLGFVSTVISETQVVCVTETLPTAAAFAVATNREVSATPVLDASRRFFLGSVSVSDARAFRSEDLRWLNEPVGSFLKRKVWPSMTPSMMPTPPPSEANDEAPTRAPFPSAVTVSPRASLLEAMRSMSRNRVHRVYVCDSPRAPPRGVCTATDVMRVFALDPETAEGRARLTW